MVGCLKLTPAPPRVVILLLELNRFSIERPPPTAVAATHVWKVTMFRDGYREVGLDLDPDTKVIRGIAPESMVAHWNEAHPDAAIRTRDRIVAVNGMSDPRLFVEALVAVYLTLGGWVANRG